MTKRFMIALATLSMVLGLVAIGGVGKADAKPDCADVQLVFARGTQEAGGMLGDTGRAFGNSLATRFPNKTVKVTAVNYEASGDFEEGVDFLKTVAKGVRNAQGQLRYIAEKCPKTRIVLGGYSQGAVVAIYAVSDQIAAAAALREVPSPLPHSVARRVAGVITFGAPADRWFAEARVPAPRVGALYRAKTRKYCIPGDNICDGGPITRPNTVHGQYQSNGMTANAADFVARRVH
ncbi:MAG: cutinase family protein [Gordonia sp. (in: high G+C Gram-positive bacteria)]|uniref:cutinase family protein n=1 Tax=Gordonia sp. (in: high G+C Gram-positive bacteria) TaxID=84139 RepID=UPI0039E5437B